MYLSLVIVVAWIIQSLIVGFRSFSTACIKKISVHLTVIILLAIYRYLLDVVEIHPRGLLFFL